MRFYRTLLSTSVPIIQTDCASAELIKLGANLYLSHRLAFIHEIAEYAHLQSLDLAAVKQAIGLDPRIGTEYFEPGLGFGGSCLPKDCYLINSRESETGFVFHTAETALEINERVLDAIVASLQTRLSRLKGKKVAILGAAFKPETDDTRGSQAVKLALKLRRRGAKVALYEPFLAGADHIVEGNLPLVHHLNETLMNAHVIVIGTAHRRFRNLRPKTVAALVKNKLVCDRFGLLTAPPGRGMALSLCKYSGGPSRGWPTACCGESRNVILSIPPNVILSGVEGWRVGPYSRGRQTSSSAPMYDVVGQSAAANCAPDDRRQVPRNLTYKTNLPRMSKPVLRLRSERPFGSGVSAYRTLSPLERGGRRPGCVCPVGDVEEHTPESPLKRGEEPGQCCLPVGGPQLAVGNSCPADVHICRPRESGLIAAHVDIRRAHSGGRTG